MARRPKPSRRVLPERVRYTLVPAVLAVVIVAGGASVPGLVSHMVLQVAAAILLLAISLRRRLFPLADDTRPFAMVVFYAGCIAAFQLVPFPSWLRDILPLGGEVARGFELTGTEYMGAPISLAPAATYGALFTLLVPVALFVLPLKVTWAAATTHVRQVVLGLVTVSVLLGGFQLLDGPRSSLYLYEITNRGKAVGLFANVNHQATFCLMALPFLANAVGRMRMDAKTGLRHPRMMVAMIAGLVVATAGVLATGSIAGVLMLPVILFLCSRLIFPRRSVVGHVKGLLPIGAALLAVGILAAFLTPQDLFSLTTELANEDQTPARIWATSLAILANSWLTGTGIGSYPAVFGLYETPAEVTNVYVNHAHNDYLEWLIETGLAGLLVLALFVRAAARVIAGVWTHADGTGMRLKKAASIAFLVPFVHSFVDYPLRTPAIAGFAALCLGIMLSPVGRTLKSREKARKKAVPTDAMAQELEL